MMMILSCKEDPIVPLQKGDLFGQVIIESNNEPVAGASITTNPPTTSIISDAEGRFALESVLAGTYSLRVEKDGFLTRLESVSVIADQSVNTVVRLTPDSLDNTAPTIPQLVYPSADAEISLEETFIWSASDIDDDELTYDLLIFNADQSETIVIAEGILDSMILVDELQYGKNYFWQVKVSDGTAEIYSEVLPFTVINIPDFRFAYVKSINNQLQIFTSNPGDDPYQLSDCPKNAWRPRLSPLRDKMAFLANVGIENHLFTMDRNGENLFQVTGIPVAGYNNFDLDYTWSPDGSQFLYMNNNRLYFINRDGTGISEYGQAPAGWTYAECDWSPLGNQIAIRIVGQAPYNSQIYVLDVDGNFITSVAADEPGHTTGGAFSVDGKSVVYSQDVSGFESPDGRQLDASIFIRQLATQELTDLSIDKPAGTNDLDPRFSPDGAFIIFTNTNNDGLSPKSIYSMKLDGTERTLLFENAEMADWE